MSFFGEPVHFSRSGKFRKMARDQNFKFAVTGRSLIADHCEQDYYKHDTELYTLGL